MVEFQDKMGILSSLARFHRDIRRVFDAAVYSVDPQVLIRNNVKVINNKLHFKVCSLDNKVYTPERNVYLCGFGKAVAPMASQLQRLLSPHIRAGVISIPSGFQEMAKSLGKHDWIPEYPIEICEGAKDNLPDDDSLEGTERILSLLKSLKSSDILIVLISGGGSALASKPKGSLDFSQKVSLIRSLSLAGATIQEVNTVRIHLSDVKGGKLLEKTKAQVVALIISDIVDSPLELIASGPTVPTNTSGEDALRILKKYGLPVDKSLIEVLTSRGEGTPTTCDNYLIGDNTMALSAAKKEAESLEYLTIIASSRLTGDARSIGKDMVKIVNGEVPEALGLEEDVKKELIGLPKDTPVCVLFGGETTVSVKGSGKGGRNQEMVLAAAIALRGAQRETVFLSAGTDGIDGPTDAAGAVTDRYLAERQKSKGLDAQMFLDNNDSYNYFKDEPYCHVRPGHTGTNVMDIQALVFMT